ncbi:hypothetical protein, partial [Xanthomonas hortorum]|uniref:hypothetical protein n=1 Tax=Xanthomonas hortorum TaxID=56454 RepID=UPI001F3DB813
MTIDLGATNATNTEGYASTTNRLRAALPLLDSCWAPKATTARTDQPLKPSAGAALSPEATGGQGCGFALR